MLPAGNLPDYFRPMNVLLCWLLAASSVIAVTVDDDASLRRALAAAKPGDEIVVKAGDYRGGIQVRDRPGTADRPIVLRAEGEVWLRGGGSTAIQFSACPHWKVKGLRAEGYPGNGFNFDDAGRLDQAVKGVVIEDLVVLRTGPRGNHDGIKMSGLVDFEVKGCRIEGWGGSAIDMVGCRDGKVTGCIIRGLDGHDSMSGIQMKGGTRGITISGTRFENAGLRAINLGGSTGKPYFRPKVTRFEASDITVAHNVFVGGQCAVAFVTADQGTVRHNLILRPEKWAFRILQEQPVPEFGACRNGRIERNIIVLPADNRVAVNVGPNTEAGSFAFRENAWFHEGGRHRPQLPSAEQGGVYGTDPKLDGEKVTARALAGFGPQSGS
jgi:hypothetical protein